MDMLFIKALNMSISASWLVLAVILFRLLLRQSPKWIHVALWALVAVRLICPFSLESDFSLIPVKTTEHIVESISGGFHGDTMIYSQGSEQYDAAVAAGITPSMGDNGYHYVLTQPDDPTKPVQTVAVLYGHIWAAGVVLMMLHALVSCLRLKKKVSASIDVGNGVYICDYIDTPFILGIAKPKIYLPSSMEPDSAAHVLAHERAHLARKDHWWKPFGYLLLTIYWFNPILWFAYILLCRDIELACDEKVIRDMELPQKKAYSEALLSCSVNRRMIAACPLAFGEVGVKERVRTVLNYKKPAFWIVLVAILALIVTAVCFLTDPVKADEAFGKIYQVEKVIYQNPVLSYYMTEANAPLFQITEEGELLIQQEPNQWESCGRFIRRDMTGENPTDWFFGDELGWEGEEGFLDVLGNIQTVWVAEFPEPQRPGYSKVYLLLRLSSGVMYLGDGYDAGNGPNINWFYRLKDAAVTEEENGDTPFGRYYRVNGLVYQNVNSGGFYPYSRYVYLLTPGRGLSEMDRMGEGGRSIARFAPTELTEENFTAYMEDHALAQDLLADNKMAWIHQEATYPNPQTKGFMYLLQQKDGTVYLATGATQDGELEIGYIFKLETILSDDPFAEASSPYQWTLNINLEYVESIRVSTNDENGNLVQTELMDYDINWFMSVLNGVSKEEITFGKLAREPYIWAQIVCDGETVELAYDKDAVSLTFPDSTLGRYPEEAGNTWIITNDALKSAMFAYNRYSFPESPFDQPDNAYHWCQTMDIALVEYVLAGDTVTVDNRYEQAYALWLGQGEIETLLNLLKSLPESSFEPVEKPEMGSRSIAIGCRNVWNDSNPWVQLHLVDGKVYYSYESVSGELYQTWVINSWELTALVSSYFTGDFTGWERFAPMPIVTGELTLKAEGITLAFPRMAAFQYEITEDGIRFKPEDQSGWLLMKSVPGPLEIDSNYLKSSTGSYSGNLVERVYGDSMANWEYLNVTIPTETGDYYVLIMNEDNASWMEEYYREIGDMIGGMYLSVDG